jgi:spore coat protein H
MSAKELPVIELFIHPHDLLDLKSDIWNDEPVNGKLKVGNKRFHIHANYRGSHIRKLKKKSYFIKYISPKKINGAKEFHLNAEYKDPSMIRNKLSLDFFRDIGVMAPSANYVILKLNGRNEGVYLQLDSVDELFLQTKNKPAGSIFYAVDDDANFSLIGSFEEGPKKSLIQGYEQKCGPKEDRKKLEELIYITNITERNEFKEEIEKYLDIKKYLQWLAGVVCTQNFDGFVHNYSLYLNSETGLFEIMPWDFDATWGRDINGKEMPYDYVRCQGFNTLSARLLDVPYYQNMYIDILREILNETFTPEYMSPIINNHFNRLLPYILDDPYLKGRQDRFEKESDFILSFITKRNNFLKGDLDKWAAGLG